MEPRVIIIGAGVAGLAAARLLSRRGVPSVLFEARHRIGGRIYTISGPLSPVPVELGAEFVHGKPPEIWRLVESGRLPALEVSGEHYLLENGKLVHDEWFDPEEAIEKADGAPEQSFEEYIRNAGVPEQQQRWATRYVEGFNAARAGEISLHSLIAGVKSAAKIESGRAFRLVRGYCSLVEWLWAAVDPETVRTYFGSVVESVQWRRGQAEVSVRMSGRSVRMFAPKLVITAPLGVLKAGAIRFQPEPEHLRAAYDSIAMGDAARITLRFRRPVWHAREEFRHLGFLHTGEPWMPTWWTTQPIESPVITGWTGGPAAEERANSDPAQWLTDTLRALARHLRTDETTLAGELESWHAHNWHTDPFTRGAYCYVRVGGMEAHRRFGDPVEDTLYFAGEAVHCEGDIGTVHGAMASGERAARLILMQQ